MVRSFFTCFAQGLRADDMRCPDGNRKARRLARPHQNCIPTLVVAGCEQSVGLGGSAPVTAIWRDTQGLHVRIGRVSNQISGAPQSATELALLSCLNVSMDRLPSYPTDSGQLLLLWRYSVTELWPCFRRHGIDIGSTPSRATFLSGDPLRIDPYYVASPSMTEAQYLELWRDCPAIPDYLSTPTPTPKSAGG